jgi:hypothetical protein
MKVSEKGHSVIIKDTQGDLSSFLTKLSNQYKTFEPLNIIVDLTPYDTLSIADVKLFSLLSKQHKKTKKSFAIVVQNIDYNAVPDQLTVVPSLLEAHDIIEMEEIERDLGF